MSFKTKKQYRHQGYNYDEDGYYFITICTKNRELFFGKINNGEIKYSLLGEAAKKCWSEIPKHFPFTKLDEFVIMPNHIHGIIIIRHEDNVAVGTQNFVFRSAGDVTGNGGTQDFAFLRETVYGNKFGPQSKNLGSIIRGFKIGVTKFANQNNLFFAWQSRFHDRIIRDEDELNRIRQYIVDNPFNWLRDRNNATSS